MEELKALRGRFPIVVLQCVVLDLTGRVPDAPGVIHQGSENAGELSGIGWPEAEAGLVVGNRVEDLGEVRRYNRTDVSVHTVGQAHGPAISPAEITAFHVPGTSESS